MQLYCEFWKKLVNMNKIFISLLLGLFTAEISVCNPRFDEFGNNPNLIEYQYRYSVDESDSKGPVMDRWEHRIGEYVKGAYSVQEPDGRIRTVDYEVDGVKGYHAVIRMNEPGPGLLSSQQLSKSIQLFPPAVLPAKSSAPSIQTRNARNDGKIWNYHSKTPYVNGHGSNGRDHREAAATQISRTVLPEGGNLPQSPANFNVPQTKTLIHFLKPAGLIYGKPTSGFQWKTTKTVAANAVPHVATQTGNDQRRIKNSKLVKRFRSMDEARV